MSATRRRGFAVALALALGGFAAAALAADPPETTIHSGPPAQTDEPEAVFEFGSNQTGVTFECSLDDAAFSACDSTITLDDLSVGSHILTARARDSLGNVDPTPASFSWEVIAGPARSFRGHGFGCSSGSAAPQMAAWGLTALGLAWLVGRRKRAAARF